MIKINDTQSYFNQFFDVTDLPETIMNEKENACNVSCVGMIIGLNPDVIIHELYKKYGYNDKFQWEENLVQELESFGYKCEKVTFSDAYPNARFIKDSELEIMRSEILMGKIILYHKFGHYQLMVGFESNSDGSFTYIFNDPAGDRKKPYSMRYGPDNEYSGHLVRYPYSMIKNEPIYGSCRSVII